MKILIAIAIALISLLATPQPTLAALDIQPDVEPALPAYIGRGHIQNDIFYYIQVDRFADGDPSNNIPLGAFPLNDPAGAIDEQTLKRNQANQVLLPYLYDPSHRYINLYWGGDLTGIIQKLDYLADLGVTQLILSPIQDAANGLIYDPHQNGYLHEAVDPELEAFDPFYSHASAGFNRAWTRDWWEIDEHFRSQSQGEDRFATFRTLLAEAHNHGIGIILELNLNHTSPYFAAGDQPFDPEQYRPWLIDQSSVYKQGKPVAEYVDSDTGEPNPQNWFHAPQNIDYNRPSPTALEQGAVDGLPDLNHQNPQVRDYLLAAIKFWLTFNQAEVPIAGLYLTAIPNIPLDFWQDLEVLVQSTNPNTILIADYGDGGYRNPASVEWYRNTKYFDLVNYSFSVATRRFFGSDRGWDGRTFVLREDMLGKSGQYYNFSWTEKFFNFLLNPSQSLEIPRASIDRLREEDAEAWLNFLEAPTQTRLLTYYPKMTETAYGSAIKFLFMSPGVPFLFYGTETGLAVPYHIDHRSNFGPGGDPFNEPMMIQPGDAGWNDTLYHLTQGLAHLRQRYPLLRYGKTSFLFPSSSHADQDLFMVRHSKRCLNGEKAVTADSCPAIVYAYSTKGGDFKLSLQDVAPYADRWRSISFLESNRSVEIDRTELEIHLEAGDSQIIVFE